jgi:hypothetical protein
MAGTYTKDPSAVLDYGINWTLWLASDTISDSTWAVARVPGGPAATAEQPDLSIDTDKPALNDGRATHVWVRGGVVGATYDLTNRITTAGGRTDERTLKIVIRQK